MSVHIDIYSESSMLALVKRAAPVILVAHVTEREMSVILVFAIELRSNRALYPC